MLGNELIQILHKLEQASSEGSIGSLAENLMEAMKDNPVVAQKVRAYFLLVISTSVWILSAIPDGSK